MHCPGATARLALGGSEAFVSIVNRSLLFLRRSLSAWTLPAKLFLCFTERSLTSPFKLTGNPAGLELACLFASS